MDSEASQTRYNDGGLNISASTMQTKHALDHNRSSFNQFVPRKTFTLFPVLAIIASALLWTYSHSLQHATKAENLVFHTCQSNFTTEILSADPLVIYINNFLSEYEANSLLTLSASFNYTYPESLGRPDSHLQARQRTSSYIILPTRSDPTLIPAPFLPITTCIAERASAFAGNLDFQALEDLQIVRYLLNERHDFHVDWHRDPDPDIEYDGPESREGRICNRRFSYFVYLDAPPLEGGGETYFPEVNGVSPTADGTKYSRTSRNERGGPGLVVRPRKGSAVFWVNLDSEGRGDERVMHAGMPVTMGRKMGMNILGEWCGPDPDFKGFKDAKG